MSTGRQGLAALSFDNKINGIGPRPLPDGSGTNINEVFYVIDVGSRK
jgi:hypothetical protein